MLSMSPIAHCLCGCGNIYPEHDMIRIKHEGVTAVGDELIWRPHFLRVYGFLPVSPVIDSATCTTYSTVARITYTSLAELVELIALFSAASSMRSGAILERLSLSR